MGVAWNKYRVCEPWTTTTHRKAPFKKCIKMHLEKIWHLELLPPRAWIGPPFPCVSSFALVVVKVLFRNILIIWIEKKIWKIKCLLYTSILYFIDWWQISIKSRWLNGTFSWRKWSNKALLIHFSRWINVLAEQFLQGNVPCLD